MFKTVVFSVLNKGFTYEVWLTKKSMNVEHLSIFGRWTSGNSSLTDFG